MAFDIGSHLFFDGERAVAESEDAEVTYARVSADDAPGELVRTETTPGPDYDTFAFTVYPGQAPVQVVGSDPFRKKVKIAVGPEGGISLGKLSTATSGFGGFRVAANGSFDTQVSPTIYAAVQPGVAVPVTVSVWVERNRSQ